MRISENTLNAIREYVDIVEVVSSYLVLKRAGANYRALCPFHSEKTPSFFVSPSKQIFHCFGCGKGGDVIKFVSEIEGLNYYDAAIKIANEYNIQIEYEEGAGYYLNLLEINNLVADFYHKNLLRNRNNEIIKNFLQKRGLTDEIIEKFQIGYADKNGTLYEFFKNRGIDIDKPLKLGLLKRKDNKIFDTFRYRIIFPIKNLRGEVIAFGGRVINDNDIPKYLNSPESEVYNKRNSLYGIFENKDNIKKSNEAIFVEGYMDLISLYKFGIKNCVASLGTSLTINQINLVKRFTDNVYFLYDGDKAGVKASIRGAILCINKNIIPKIILLPSNIDPDDFIKDNGKEEFLKIKKEALDLPDFMYEKIKKLDLTQIEIKMNIIKRLKNIYNDIDNPIYKDHFIRKFSSYLKIEENELKKYFSKNFTVRKFFKDEKDENKKNLLDIEDKLIAFILQNNNKEYFEKLEESLIFSEFNKKILNFLKTSKNFSEIINSDNFSEKEKEKLRTYLLIDLGINTDEEKVKFFTDSIKKLKSKKVKILIEKLTKQLKEFEKENNIDSQEYRDILFQIRKLKEEEQRIWS